MNALDAPGARLLVVGSNATNLRLLADALEAQGYACEAAHGLEGFDEVLASEAAFDLALVDVTGLDASVWQRCQRLHDNAVRLLVISPRASASLQQQGIAHGAGSVLVKPLVVRELADLIQTLLAS